MSEGSGGRGFISEWLLEFSVLWAVFPMLDQMLTGRFQAWIIGIAWALSMVSFVGGFLTRPRER